MKGCRKKGSAYLPVALKEVLMEFKGCKIQRLGGRSDAKPIPGARRPLPHRLQLSHSMSRGPVFLRAAM